MTGEGPHKRSIASSIAKLVSTMAVALICMSAIFHLSELRLARSDEAPSAAVLELYSQFAAAQNRRDLQGVRELLSPRPDFLWISDGQPFCGRDAMIERMAGFQKAEVWKVEPDYSNAKVVPVNADAAYLHIPLVLVLGSHANPQRLNWLVAVLCTHERRHGRLQHCSHTEDKRPR